MTNKEYWYWFCNIKGLGAVGKQALLENFSSVQDIFSAAPAQLEAVEGIHGKTLSSIIMSRNEDKIKESYAKLRENNIYFVSREDEDYPQRLRTIYHAPDCLYVKGRLPAEDKVNLAIVGARNCSGYGKEAALYFSKALSDAGIQVISGLARGIDGYAHWGALRGQTPTFGVLGCGIDICYPKENISLYRIMEERGGILSEYGPGVQGIPGYFPMRNRIISGLSDGVAVIEAKERSGSLITADLALEQGKTIFALPGRLGDSLSSGCNRLIKMGAELLEAPSDILEHYHIAGERKRMLLKKNDNLLETNDKIVYACLSLVPKHINDIAKENTLLMTDIMKSLTVLELKGYIKQTTNLYYVVRIDGA